MHTAQRELGAGCRVGAPQHCPSSHQAPVLLGGLQVCNGGLLAVSLVSMEEFSGPSFTPLPSHSGLWARRWVEQGSRTRRSGVGWGTGHPGGHGPAWGLGLGWGEEGVRAQSPNAERGSLQRGGLGSEPTQERTRLPRGWPWLLHVGEKGILVGCSGAGCQSPHWGRGLRVAQKGQSEPSGTEEDITPGDRRRGDGMSAVGACFLAL